MIWPSNDLMDMRQPQIDMNHFCHATDDSSSIDMNHFCHATDDSSSIGKEQGQGYGV